jgi:hypothetical protein
VLANDSDPEGHALTVTITAQPVHGHLSLGAGGAFSYTPEAGYFGLDSFSYTVSDGRLDSNVATVQLTVNEVNLPPVANDDVYVVQQGSVLKVAPPGVLTNDSDPEGHSLVAIVVTQPAFGHLVPVVGGGFEYYPDAGYSGSDSFTYKASDGDLESAIATGRIRVVPLSLTPIPAVPIGYPALMLLALMLLVSASRSRVFNSSPR